MTQASDIVTELDRLYLASVARLKSALTRYLTDGTPPAPEAQAPAIVEEAEANQPVGSHMPDGEADLCKAADYQYLIGKHRNEIPVPVEVVNRRVTCTTCAVTMDFNPNRLNIVFDEASGVIREVKCG